jgi:4-hydroxy-4-methyl-2-oxoglutarate aldolase
MIEDPPLLTVRRRTARPDFAKLGALAGVQTGNLVDAMDGRGALDYAIKPIDPKRSAFVGPALTCEPGPSDNLAILAAIALAAPGDVIVAAGDGFTGTAIVGDNMAAMARNRQVAAIVADGLVRDSAGVVGVGLPMFARGITPNSCAKSGPGRVGLPVVVGGVSVEAGDVVVGDLDGVVVIPRAQLDAVLDRLAAVRRAEAALQEKIARGLDCPEAVRALLGSDRVRYVD